MAPAAQTHLDQVFAALSDPTRRAILARLARGEASVGEIAGPFEVSAPAISKHLKVLERAGLLLRRVEGRTHFCSLLPGPLRTASEWIETYEHFWESQFDALETYLELMAAQRDAPRAQDGDTDDSNDDERET